MAMDWFESQSDDIELPSQWLKVPWLILPVPHQTFQWSFKVRKDV
jgi:hypothetical protein